MCGNLPPDDELRAIVLEKWKKQSGSRDEAFDDDAVSLGRPTEATDRHEYSFVRIQQLRSEGKSIDHAAEIVAKEIPAKFGVTVSKETITAQYKRDRRVRPLEDYIDALIDRDIEAAIDAVKRMTANDQCRHGFTRR